MSAANVLLTGILSRLSGDAVLATMIGPGGIRDRLSPRPDLPAIVFGEMETRDFSTSTEAAEEHRLTLEVWSEAEGRRQAEEIAGRVRLLLHDAPLALDGFALVGLSHGTTRTQRQAKTRLFRAELRFRAVTEPAAAGSP